METGNGRQRRCKDVDQVSMRVVRNTQTFNSGRHLQQVFIVIQRKETNFR